MKTSFGDYDDNYNTPRLLTPGPVPIPPQILQTMARPLIHHRSQTFTDILKNVFKHLQLVFQTHQSVFLQTATGTGLMESALVNTLSPGNEVLVVNGGKFGQRWLDMSRSLQLNPKEVAIPWGKSLKSEMVKNQISKDTKAILIQASETSTGVLHPIQEIAQITENTDVLLIVDASSALGVVDLPMDKWGLDVVLAAGQKAFMLPPGLGFIALSQKAKQHNSASPKFYWDLQAEQNANQKGQTRFTSAILHIQILQKVFQDKYHEIYSKNRYQKIAKAFDAASQPLGLNIFPENPSPALTVFTKENWINHADQHIGANAIKSHLEEKYKITIAGGQSILEDRVLRIGHLGHITDRDILAIINALAKTLQHFGFICDGHKAILEASKALALKDSRSHLKNA